MDVVKRATEAVGEYGTRVSLVLNGRGKGNIAADKQALILDAAKKLNYTPNTVALSLRSRRSSTIGVHLDPYAGGISGVVLDRFVHALTEHAGERGQQRAVIFQRPQVEDKRAVADAPDHRRPGRAQPLGQPLWRVPAVARDRQRRRGQGFHRQRARADLAGTVHDLHPVVRQHRRHGGEQPKGLRGDLLAPAGQHPQRGQPLCQPVGITVEPQRRLGRGDAGAYRRLPCVR